MPRKTYFPGFIGGHCVISNIHLLVKIAFSPLLRSLLESNELRRLELAQGQSANSKQAANSRDDG